MTTRTVVKTAVGHIETFLFTLPEKHFTRLRNLLIFIFKTGTMGIQLISTTLTPIAKRIVGCMEPFCSYLPNSHKTDRGNTEKQTKILLRASVYGWRNLNNVSMPSPHKSENNNNQNEL